jgi:hypothetical protein
MKFGIGDIVSKWQVEPFLTSSRMLEVVWKPQGARRTLQQAR